MSARTWRVVRMLPGTWLGGVRLRAVASRSGVAAARWLVSMLLLAGLAPSASAAVSRHVDDAGRTLELSAPVRRVITLAPNLTELVYAVGAGDTLIATDSRSDYPAAAKSLPRIGDFQRLDLEHILTLKPDLVLAWNHGTPARELALLERAGLPLFRIEPSRLEDVPRALERVGELLGHAAQGQAEARSLRRQIENLRSRHAGVATVRVFYQAWQNPLMTLSAGQIVSDVLALCGGSNVFAELPQLVPQISTESVLAANPEVILAAREEAGASAAAGAVRDAANPMFTRWRRYPTLTAVRRGWLYTLPGDAITRQGPRIIGGAQAVCAALDEVRAERPSRR